MKKLVAVAFAAASLASFGAFSTAEFAAIVRVPFPGEYAPKFLKVGVGSVGANSIVSATVLTTK